MSDTGAARWLRGPWARREGALDIPRHEGTVVVHYSRYWLPHPVGPDEDWDRDLDLSRTVEVILEPQVLWCCLLRKVTNYRILMVPSPYDRFAGGPMPAAYVDNSSCFEGEPLRQESLMRHLLGATATPAGTHPIMRSEFRLYEPPSKPDPATHSSADVHAYHSGGSILSAYVEKHLRYAVLFLIWVYPKISQNVTRSIILNSSPWPYGHYVYYARAREVARACAQCGYSNLTFTLKELGLMLKELQRVLRSDVRSLNQRPGCWMEGSIFANLAVLFSIPCHGIEELLAFHREFYDLKTYCAVVNRTYSVADLPPPFLCGNTFPISYFLKEPSAPVAIMGHVWDKLADFSPLKLVR
ncbi:metaxin 2, putative [Babesia caballi]|uniref:Metaxin 2, putative n=1 Tax=Babesia caballi TaxID=5871 RepID=A0AAV4M2S7_BABCB|nr:metaxin 2, putative [Babesia caballi]